MKKRSDPPQKSAVLQAIYDQLLAHYGPQDWWPGETPFEVCIGAILTQNTNWKNVEKAIANLREAKLLDLGKANRCPLAKLAQLIRPAGYFNVKALRLKNFFTFLVERHGGSLETLGQLPWPVARAELLSVNGIGNETADSILLYALNKPVFVIDVYTKRLLLRHGFKADAEDYASMQELFMSELSGEAVFYNEYHALIVQLGKSFREDALDRPEYPLKEKKYFLYS